MPLPPEESMHRIVIFANSASEVPAILFKGTLAALTFCSNVELVGVCLPKAQAYSRAVCHHFVHRMSLDLTSLLDPTLRRHHPPPLPINLNRWTRRFQFRVLVPPKGDINHPHFIAWLQQEIRPTIALSFYCLQKFSPDLLAVFSHAVNYHNGLLPSFRGRKATAWSLYHGEKETGFAFHRMVQGFDEGPILVQGTVPIRPDSNASDLDLEKATAAASHIPRLLRMVVDGNPGEPQRGKARYFSMKDQLALTTIPDPSVFSSVELIRRLRAFGCLHMRIGDVWHEVTKIRTVPELSGNNGRFRFHASDGVRLEPVRFRHLSYAIYWLLARAMRRHPRESPPDFRGV